MNIETKLKVQIVNIKKQIAALEEMKAKILKMYGHRSLGQLILIHRNIQRWEIEMQKVYLELAYLNN